MRHNKSSTGDNNNQQHCTCTLHLVLVRDHLRWRVGRQCRMQSKDQFIQTISFFPQLLCSDRPLLIPIRVFTSKMGYDEGTGVYDLTRSFTPTSNGEYNRIIMTIIIIIMIIIITHNNNNNNNLQLLSAMDLS